MEKVRIDSIFLPINQKPILYRQRRSWQAMGLRRILREAKKLLYVPDNENNTCSYAVACVAVCELRSLKTNN